MKAVIIEDEKKNRVQLKSLLVKHCKQVRLIGEAADADEGIKMIKEINPDLIFLDIQMPHQSGFDMLAALGEYNFEVIFVTGYDQYGVQAIKFSALDYLLKPVKPDELIKAVTKAETKKRKKQTHEQIINLLSVVNNSRKTEHRIALPMMKEIRFISPDEIIRCESANNYTQFYLQNGEKLLVSKGIYAYDEMLKDYHFIRCHQSHLVNRIFIKSLLKEDTIFELLLKDGSHIPVSRLKIDMVKEELIK
ncbi:transcriptional regulatory protein YehT [mine drainage metagenome]|uniref:Transcriptional regulatory protein YehT n=1 Tax=mine drainage metagenome TaxID=410659 RepID=A0A1J5SAW9_9ZZZZ